MSINKDSQKAPNLRFKGFTDDWEQRKLGDYIIPYSETTTINNQYPVFTSSRKGLFFQQDYYNGHQIASEDNTGYNIVPRGYFTYRHMSDDLVFKFNINNLADYGIVSTLYPVFTTSEDLDSEYLEYQLNEGREFKQFAILQKQGGSRTYMYLSKLQNLKLSIPNIEEQQKISQYFKKLDDTITLHQRKLDQLNQLKEALLQQMFPGKGETVPKLRFAGFEGDWEERKLGDLLHERNQKSVQTEEYPLVSFTVENGVTEKTERYNRNQLVSGDSDAKVYKVTKLNDIVYNPANLKFGAIDRNKYGKAVFSPIYVTFEVIEDYIFAEFIEFIVTSQTFIGRALKYQQGTVYERQSVGVDDFLNLTIRIPNLDEQKLIGLFLNDLNKKLLLQKDKLDQLKNTKQVLLENMFI